MLNCDFSRVPSEFLLNPFYWQFGSQRLRPYLSCLWQRDPEHSVQSCRQEFNEVCNIATVQEHPSLLYECFRAKTGITLRDDQLGYTPMKYSADKDIHILHDKSNQGKNNKIRVKLGNADVNDNTRYKSRKNNNMLRNDNGNTIDEAKDRNEDVISNRVNTDDVTNSRVNNIDNKIDDSDYNVGDNVMNVNDEINSSNKLHDKNNQNLNDIKNFENYNGDDNEDDNETYNTISYNQDVEMYFNNEALKRFYGSNGDNNTMQDNKNKHNQSAEQLNSNQSNELDVTHSQDAQLDYIGRKNDNTVNFTGNIVLSNILLDNINSGNSNDKNNVKNVNSINVRVKNGNKFNNYEFGEQNAMNIRVEGPYNDEYNLNNRPSQSQNGAVQQVKYKTNDNSFRNNPVIVFNNAGQPKNSQNYFEIINNDNKIRNVNKVLNVSKFDSKPMLSNNRRAEKLKDMIDPDLTFDIENSAIDERFRKKLRQIFFNYRGCIGKTFSDIKTCIPVINRQCDISPVRVLKEVRLDLRLIPSILEQDRSVKVIHLVRDPRGQLVFSRKLATIDKLCQRMLRDLHVARIIEQKYPNSIYRVRYEDLVLMPGQTARRVFRHVGINGQQYYRAWLQKTANPVRNTGALGTYKEDPMAEAYDWRTILPKWVQRKVMQEPICAQVIAELGYPPS